MADLAPQSPVLRHPIEKLVKIQLQAQNKSTKIAVQEHDYLHNDQSEDAY